MRKGKCPRNLPSSQDRICRETAWLQAGPPYQIPGCDWLQLAGVRIQMLPSHNRATFGIALAAGTSLVFSRCILLARFSLLAMTFSLYFIFIFLYFIFVFVFVHLVLFYFLFYYYLLNYIPPTSVNQETMASNGDRNARTCLLRCCLLAAVNDHVGRRGEQVLYCFAIWLACSLVVIDERSRHQLSKSAPKQKRNRDRSKDTERWLVPLRSIDHN